MWVFEAILRRKMAFKKRDVAVEASLRGSSKTRDSHCHLALWGGVWIKNKFNEPQLHPWIEVLNPRPKLCLRHDF
jgi:hypothetical protein